MMTACGTVEQEFSAPTSGAKGPGFRHEAERINAAHAAVVAAERDALRHAVRAGALLEAMKGRLGHGRFLPWIAEHCDFACPVPEPIACTAARCVHRSRSARLSRAESARGPADLSSLPATHLLAPRGGARRAPQRPPLRGRR